MAKFFISDTHFGHKNILNENFENRPFKNIDYMNESIIRNWNSRVKEDDTVYFLGDFCWKSNYKNFRKQLNGEIVFIKGNHDSNNSLNTILTHAIIEAGNKVMLLQHIPPLMEKEIPDMCDLVLCGHVHSKWKHIFLNDIPIINCSVEVWNYRPVKLEEILVYYDKIMKDKILKRKLSKNEQDILFSNFSDDTCI